MSTGITHYSLRSIIVSAAIQKLEAVVTSNLSAPAGTVEFWLDNGATAEQAADWGDLIWQNTPSYVADLINHYATEWKNSKADLDSVKNLCHTHDQCAYLDVLLEIVNGVVVASKSYAGSTYGQGGCEKRVYREHLNPDYRATRPSQHYFYMEQEGVVPHLVPVTRFKDRQPKEVVILAETIMADIFGSHISRFNQEHRHPLLPEARFGEGLNVIEPLMTEGHYDWMAARVEASRYTLFRKVLEGGYFPIWRHINHPHRVRPWIQYGFRVSQLKVLIDAKAVHALMLDAESSEVFVSFEVAHEGSTHPCQWAEKAIDTDDGSKIGIKLTVGALSSYIHSRGTTAVATANAFHDWLLGKLVDVSKMDERHWGSDRNPFMGPYAETVLAATWEDYFADPQGRIVLRDQDHQPVAVTWATS
ncbi:hypothetical protein M438DRAFT_351297 [Aureobasidium pullulans EXF-150]|uniref:Uncharacterized protein n=1 Tax=Aureobasidium pullulans EXF-150 TaxID=1043002 RepID=A0A074Y6T6_AURPU|nr:uncharacterized protein M438DRAFT_351297 [Aureobasidium pullulans EXF-150]KEQ89952.1 hypothetical protein M438DRAFT_351297 [Aureobasidium pullulans EXF-150]